MLGHPLLLPLCLVFRRSYRQHQSNQSPDQRLAKSIFVGGRDDGAPAPWALRAVIGILTDRARDAGAGAAVVRPRFPRVLVADPHLADAARAGSQLDITRAAEPVLAERRRSGRADHSHRRLVRRTLDRPHLPTSAAVVVHPRGFADALNQTAARAAVRANVGRHVSRR